MPEDAPAELRDLILECLESRPSQRPSALQLYERLRSIPATPPLGARALADGGPQGRRGPTTGAAGRGGPGGVGEGEEEGVESREASPQRKQTAAAAATTAGGEAAAVAAAAHAVDAQDAAAVAGEADTPPRRGDRGAGFSLFAAAQ